MKDDSTTTEIIDEVPADLITPADMPACIQGFTPIAEGIEMTALGLRITADEVEAQDFHRLFNSVLALSRASSWLIGDTLNLADRKWGNRYSGTKYDEASLRTGLSVGTLRHIAMACKTIPLDQRRDDLSFTHHLNVCGTADTSEERQQLLDEAKEKQMNAKVFRKHLREIKAVKATKDAWENGTENLDRPFGIMNIPTKDEVPSYPLASEFSRVSAWLEGRDLRKLKPIHREELAVDLVHIMRDGYALLQLIRRDNPDAEFDLPFDIKSIDEVPLSFLRPIEPLPDPFDDI